MELADERRPAVVVSNDGANVPALVSRSAGSTPELIEQLDDALRLH